MERLALNALSHEGVRTPWSDKAKAYQVDFGMAKLGAFGGVHEWLRWVRPIYAVSIGSRLPGRDLTSTEIASRLTSTEIASLYAAIEPGDLRYLSIFGIDSQALPAWDGLDALTQLAIHDNTGLQALPAWDGLAALTYLTISGNDSLQALPAWDGLDALTQLEINNNAGLQALPAWDGLAALTQLTISRNDGLQALPASWAELQKLEELRLEGAFLPAVLPEIAKLPALRHLLLPIHLEGVKLARPDDLPPVDVGFADPGSLEWWEWDEG